MSEKIEPKALVILKKAEQAGFDSGKLVQDYQKSKNKKNFLSALEKEMRKLEKKNDGNSSRNFVVPIFRDIVDGEERFVFLDNDKWGELMLKMYTNALHYLIKKENPSLEGFSIMTTTKPFKFQGHNFKYIKSITYLREYKSQELLKMMNYIFEEQQKKQEILGDMESKIHLLNLSYEDEGEYLHKCLFAGDEEIKELYFAFLEDLKSKGF